MTPTVAIIAPGNMGSGVGQRLTEHKVKVLTSLAGRSEASAKRARAAGMVAVADAQLIESDFLLSIVPPGDALALAKRLAGVLTAASALKMSYAGITKGFTALGAAMMLAATRGGSAEALKAELAESRPDLLGYLSKQVPAMYSKAYRWVAELEEISDFVGKDHAEHAMMDAAARLYQRIAADLEGENKEVGAMDEFLKS